MPSYYDRSKKRDRYRFRLKNDYPSALDAAKDNGYTTPQQVNDFRRANPNTYRYTRGSYLNVPRQRDREREVPDLGKPRWQPAPREKPLSAYKVGAPIPGIPFDQTPSAADFVNRNQLPMDYYRFFYGDASNRQAEMRSAERRASTLRGLQAARSQEESQARAAEAAARAPDLFQQPIGTQSNIPRTPSLVEATSGYGQSTTPPSDAALAFRPVWNAAKQAWETVRNIPEYLSNARQTTQQMGREFLRENTTLYQDLGMNPYGYERNRAESARNQYRYGGANVVQPDFVQQLQDQAAQATINAESPGPRSILGGNVPYTPQWVEPWLDARDPNQPLTDEEIYMLELIGYYEPMETSAASVSGGGGGGYYRGGGGGGGGGGSYTPSSYNPRRQGAGQARGGQSLGLVSWRI